MQHLSSMYKGRQYQKIACPFAFFTFCYQQLLSVQLDTLFFALLPLTIVSATSLAATDPGPDGGGYYTGKTVYNWVEISETGTLVSLDDEDVSNAITFPQDGSFTFYGTAYSAIHIQSNGLISFFQDSNSVEIIDNENVCPLPENNSSLAYIAMMWADLDPSYDGAVYFQQFNQNCPYNAYQGSCLVVEFKDIQFFGAIDTGDDEPASTFEALLLDNNHIIIQFNSSTLGTDWGLQSTTGINGANFASDYGLSFSCNTASSLYPGLAIEFIPPAKKTFFWPMFLPAIIR